MNIPLQVTFRNMEPSPALEARIQELIARLDRFSAQILRCTVVVERPHQHAQQGGLFAVRINITVPDHEIAIRRASPVDHSHEDPYVALRDAFRAARRKLEDYEKKRRRSSHLFPSSQRPWPGIR